MPVLQTPKWNIQKVVEKDVYEPSEDTFLLIDAIENDIETILENKPGIILEVGSGSGVVISAMSSIFQNAAFCFALDISRNACLMTKDTAALNEVQLDVINGDLLCNIRHSNLIDVIIFNPPYVRTEPGEPNCGIALTYAGGLCGREVMDRIFPQLYSVLSNQGLFYLVVTEYNKIEDIYTNMNEYGFSGSQIMKRQIRGELLFVLRFMKK